MRVTPSPACDEMAHPWYPDTRGVPQLNQKIRRLC